ncbi:MAG: hypothetical protein ACOC0N_04840 [Chroococcales cyanobacterium]
MTEKPYDSEALLEELLETYPHLLAVNETANGASRRWLIVERQVGVPSEETGMQRWSFNHLFLDQYAIPTLVEVRRMHDPQVRREVIGQMIDYAANVLAYWPVESILSQFEANCRAHNRDPEQVFEEFSRVDEDQFWQQVKTNLQAGKVRLVFVADQINAELQRVVEFLNKQMDPAEVLAVEIKQYVSSEDDDLKTLVSKVIGQTAEAKQKKASTTRERRQWDERSFFTEYKARYGKDEAYLAQKTYQWVLSHRPQLDVQWSTGDIYGGFAAKLKSNETQFPVELFFVSIEGILQIASDHYATLPPFNSEQEWQELRNQFSSIGLALPTELNQRRFPNFQLSTLPDQAALDQVLRTFDWVLQKVQSAM